MTIKQTGKNSVRAAVLAVCALTASAFPAMAQENGAPPPPPAGQEQGPSGHHDPAQMESHQIEMLTKHLNLTPDQVTQVKAIDDTQRTEMMALRDDTTIARPDKRSKMMAIRQGSQAKVRAVLTDDQKSKYDALLARQKERMENHQGGPPPPPQQ